MYGRLHIWSRDPYLSSAIGSPYLLCSSSSLVWRVPQDCPARQLQPTFGWCSARSGSFCWLDSSATLVCSVLTPTWAPPCQPGTSRANWTCLDCWQRPDSPSSYFAANRSRSANVGSRELKRLVAETAGACPESHRRWKVSAGRQAAASARPVCLVIGSGSARWSLGRPVNSCSSEWDWWSGFGLRCWFSTMQCFLPASSALATMAARARCCRQQVRLGRPILLCTSYHLATTSPPTPPCSWKSPDRWFSSVLCHSFGKRQQYSMHSCTAGTPCCRPFAFVSAFQTIDCRQFLFGISGAIGQLVTISALPSWSLPFGVEDQSLPPCAPFPWVWLYLARWYAYYYAFHSSGRGAPGLSKWISFGDWYCASLLCRCRRTCQPLACFSTRHSASPHRSNALRPPGYRTRLWSLSWSSIWYSQSATYYCSSTASLLMILTVAGLVCWSFSSSTSMPGSCYRIIQWALCRGLCCFDASGAD